MTLAARAAKIGKMGSIYTVGSFIPLFAGIFLLPIYTRYLISEQMGIVRLATQFVGVMGVFIELGISAALKRHYFQVDPEQRPQLVRTAFWGQIMQAGLICTVLSAAGVFVSEMALPNLPLNSQQIYILWLMIVWGGFFQAVSQLGIGVTALQERPFASVSIRLLTFAVQASLGISAVVLLSWKGFGRQFTVMIGTITGGLLAGAYLFTAGKGGFEFRTFRKILKTGLTFVPHRISGMLSLAINAWLVTKFLGSAAIGIYSVAIMFPSMIQLPLWSLGRAMYPTLAELMRDGTAEAKRQQSRLYTLVAIAISVMILGVAVLGPILVRVLTAPQYHEAAQYVPLLTLAWLFQGLYIVASQPVFFTGGGLWMAAATVSSVLANLVLSIILIPLFGIYGAAFSMIGCFVARFIVIAVISHKQYPLPWEAGKLLRILSAVAVLAALDQILLTRLDIWLSVCLKAAVILSFIPALWMVKAVSTAEIVRLKTFVFARFAKSRKNRTQ